MKTDYRLGIALIGLSLLVSCTMAQLGNCTNQYSMGAAEPGRQIFRGEAWPAQDQATTVELCQEECLGRAQTNPSACVAIGFDTTGGRANCYINEESDSPDVNNADAAYATYPRIPNPDCITTTLPGSASETTTPTGAGCTDTFTVTEGRNGAGGVERAGANTQELCNTACLELPITECAAYDFNTLNNRCYILTSEPASLGTLTGVNHYRRDACEDCTPSYTSVSGTGSRGGTDNAATTLADCEAACTADETCVGFDFATNNDCFLHLDQGQFESNTYQWSEVTQYTKVVCPDSTGTPDGSPTPVTGVTGGPCTPSQDTFNKEDNTNVGGAREEPSASTVTECEVYCLSQARDMCVAFNFNRDNNQCWIHVNSIGAKSPNNNIDFYERVDCVSGVCAEDTFNLVEDTNAQGANRDTSADTEPECKAVCLGQSSCVGYIMNTNENPNQCWIFDNADNIVEGRRQGLAGLDLYVRQPCQAVCTVDTFNLVEDTNAQGANRDTSADTEPECKAVCLGQSSCVGYIMNTNENPNQCWIFDNADNIVEGRRQGLAGLDLYVRQPCSAVCAEDTFDLVVDTNAQGANRDTSADTEPECKAVCLGQSSCVGYIMNTNENPNQCWIFDNADNIVEGRRQGLAGLNLYVRQPCQVGTATPTGTGTPDATGTGTPVTPGAGICYTEEDYRYYGANLNSANTLGTCQTACDDNTDCVAYAFITGIDDCYIHTSQSDLDGRRDQSIANYKSYIKGTCEGCERYSVENGKQYFGAVSNSANTVDGCKSACDADSDCVAIGYTISLDECFLHRSPTQIADGARVDDNSNIDTYKKVEDCVPGTPITPTSDCTVSYTLEADRQYDGATQDNSANTNAACEAICNADSACFGYGFSVRGDPDTCFIHRQVSDFNSNPIESLGYDTYKKSTECITTPPGCVVEYTVDAGSFSTGGTFLSDVTGVTDCQAWCTGNADCGALDINSANQCWWHNNGDWQNSLNENGGSGVSQYRKVPCVDGTGTPTASGGCVDRFNGIPGRFATNGNRAVDVDTNATCAEACLDLPLTSCVGYDFNTQDSSCWIHDDAGVFANLQIDRNNVITNYERVACLASPPVCIDSFTKNDNTQALGADPAPSAVGLDACADRCRALADCVGFDVVNSNGECWIHTNANALVNSVENLDIDNYVRVPCQDATGGTPGVGTGGTPGGTAVVTSCPITFTEEADTFAFNGDRVVSANTLALCREDCRGMTSCVAFDFNSENNQCFRHTDTANLENSNKGESNVINHYVKNPCDSPPASCEDIFEQVANANAFDGDYRATAGTVDECKRLCLSDDTCLALDFNGGCYLHFVAANIERLRTGIEGVDHYRRMTNPNCPDGTPRTTRAQTGTQQACVVLDAYAPVRVDTAHNLYTTNMQASASGQTVASCQNQCNSMADCKSFMFYRFSATCVFFDTFGEETSFQGFDYYERQQDCGDASSCPPVYNSQNNRGSYGGIEVPLANEFSQCLGVCVDNTNCAGFDFVTTNTLNQRCYTHTSATIVNVKPVQDSIGSMQYTIVQRGCPVTTPAPPPGPCPMVNQTGLIQDGGDPVMNGALPMEMTGIECRDRCGRDDFCKAADYNKLHRVCFLHYVDGPVMTGSCCDHFVKQRCPICLPTFRWREQLVPNIGVAGLLRPSPNPTDCASQCFRNPSCDAITFGRVNLECRLFLGIGVLETAQLTSDQFTDFHFRDRCQTQTPTPPVNPSPTPAPPTCIKVGFDEFRGEEIFSEPGVQNTAIVPGITSDSACRAACSSTPQCVAVVYNPRQTARRCVWFSDRRFRRFRPTDASVGLVSVIYRCQGDSTPAPTGCGNPPALANGRWNLVSPAIGGRASAICNNGFNLAGNVDVFCQSNGQWTTPPTCEAVGVVSCGNPPALANGRWNLVSSAVGGRASAICNNGFNLAGNVDVFCQSNGQWTTPPTCQAVGVVNCGNPGLIPNGGPSGTFPTTVGSVATYACNQGFELSGNSQVACQANGQWTARPTCTAVPVASCRLAGGLFSGSPFDRVGNKIPMPRSQPSPFSNARPEGSSQLTDIVSTGACAGNYFVCFSMGLQSNTGGRVELSGNYGFTVDGRNTRRYQVAIQREDRSHQGLDTLGRCLIVRGDGGGPTSFSLLMREGTAYSDGIGLLTSLSVFSLDDWSGADDTNFMVGRRDGEFGCAGNSAPPCVLGFQATANQNPSILTGAAFNTETNTYICPSSGTYLFTYTYGAPSGVATEVSLRRTSPAGPQQRATANWPLERRNTNANGVDTVSKTVIMNCMAGESVSLMLGAGRVVTNDNVLTSFSGFKYQPADTSQPLVAWSFYRSSQIDLESGSQLNTILFDVEDVNEGNAYNPQTGQARIDVSGTYFIYLSTGIPAAEYSSAFVRTNPGPNSVSLFGVSRLHTGTVGQDQLGRGAIVYLEAGTIIYVNALRGSVLAGGRTTSFGGILLYR